METKINNKLAKRHEYSNYKEMDAEDYVIPHTQIVKDNNEDGTMRSNLTVEITGLTKDNVHFSEIFNFFGDGEYKYYVNGDGNILRKIEKEQISFYQKYLEENENKDGNK